MNGTGFNAGVTVDWQQVTLLPAGVFRALAMAAGTAQNSTLDIPATNSGVQKVLVTLDNGFQFNVTAG
jgi:hypothetical protein